MSLKKRSNEPQYKECNLKGYEGLYRIYEDGSVWSKRGNRFLKPYITYPYKYAQYQLNRAKGDEYKEKTPSFSITGRFFAHRLVLHHFIGPCPPGKECHHIDHNRLNNHVSNLKWVTHSENILLSYKENGRYSYWKGKTRPTPSIETRLKMRDAKLKPCKAININTGSVFNFDSIEDLCNDLGIYRKAFNRSIMLDKPYKQYRFEYCPKRYET